MVRGLTDPWQRMLEKRDDDGFHEGISKFIDSSKNITMQRVDAKLSDRDAQIEELTEGLKARHTMHAFLGLPVTSLSDHLSRSPRTTP